MKRQREGFLRSVASFTMKAEANLRLAIINGSPGGELLIARRCLTSPASNKVREIRTSQHLSQMALAVRAGLSLSTIWLLDQGLRMGPGTQKKVATALNVPLERVFPPIEK